MLQRIAILGLGLIGSSLARALTERQASVHIAAFDASHKTLTFAIEHGFVHSRHTHAEQATREADIVVLATPPSAFAELAANIAPFLKAGAVVTDVASVKRYAVNAIAPHLPEHVHFVPGHPIAGSEQSGVAAGHTDLFAAKRVILTPQENVLMSEAVARVRMLWEATGARVEYMPPDLHDRIYAYVSHLPQLAAFAARHCMQGVPPAADETGMRFARLMKSDPTLWADIFLTNADYVDEALTDFMTFAKQIEGELFESPAAGNTDALPAAVLFPRVVATCLIASASLLQEITGVHPARYAGAGFVDMTAPALGDPDTALAGISSHHGVIAHRLKNMLERLLGIRETLSKGDKSSLIRLL